MLLPRSNLHSFFLFLIFCVYFTLYYMILAPTNDVTAAPIVFKLNEDRKPEEKRTDTEDVIKLYVERNDPIRNSRIQQRGDYWVMYNYVKSSKTFLTYESVTYTTHGEYTFLDNLIPLVEKWMGPISLALYAPGNDFRITVDSIRYLRDCSTNLIRELVTFHIFFNSDHIPREIPPIADLLKKPYKCNKPPPYFNVHPKETYRAVNKLFYPVNVARNIAKETSQTHFVLASDIELYPSLNIIPDFLEMIANNWEILERNPVIFPLNLFEVTEGSKVPGTKTQLQRMLANKTAVNFHQEICPKCHNTPNYQEWIKRPETEGLNVFHVAKRVEPFERWEPIYIGTKNDPAYDERMAWEGKSDKMTQGYILCVQDYDMMILDNAFLVHKPGIKSSGLDPERKVHESNTNNFLTNTVEGELRKLYGTREGCTI